jgi:hypothetical protein
MKKLSLLHKLCFVLALFSVVGSIVVNIISGNDVTWQSIFLLWILSAIMAEIRIKNLEDKQ